MIIVVCPGMSITKQCLLNATIEIVQLDLGLTEPRRSMELRLANLGSVFSAFCALRERLVVLSSAADLLLGQALAFDFEAAALALLAALAKNPAAAALAFPFGAALALMTALVNLASC